MRIYLGTIVWTVVLRENNLVYMIEEHLRIFEDAELHLLALLLLAPRTYTSLILFNTLYLHLMSRVSRHLAGLSQSSLIIPLTFTSRRLKNDIRQLHLRSDIIH